MAETAVKVRSAAAARALDAVVDRLAGEVSASRARQLRMVVGMWDRALGEAWPAGVRRPRTARGLFADGPLGAFWELAVAGQLRDRVQDVGRVLPVATQRVVRDCLGLLADEVVPREAVWLPRVPQQEPKAVVPERQLPVLYRRLVDMAAAAPEERGGVTLRQRDRARLLAMVVVVLDCGARSGELEAMRVEDLAEGEAAVLVRRQPQNGVPAEEVCALREGSRVAVRRWLAVRRRVVEENLEGSDPRALWVGLQRNMWQHTPGLPLQSRGIQRAYARGVGLLNMLMAGEYGWEPLPRTLEQLRRGVTPTP